MAKRLITGVIATLGLLVGSAANATYTKIANNGADLADGAVLGSGATDWSCTRDNDTGLIWEVKTDDGGLRDKDGTYTNLDRLNGATGNVGGFINVVNAAALCGYGEWRMPSKDELLALYSKIGSGYFPNTNAGLYWSGTTAVGYPESAWHVNFANGNVYFDYGYSHYAVRLVRGGPSLVTLTLSMTTTGSGSGQVTSGGLDCVRSGGTTTGNCSADRGIGTTVTLTATPDTGSTFIGWGGACSGTNLTCTVVMDVAKDVSANFVKQTPTTALVLDPTNPATLYGGLDGAGVYASTDSGGNWAAINIGLTNLSVRALAIQNSSTLYAATYDGGVFKGTLSGSWSWTACGSLPDGTRLRSLIVDPSGNLYAGSETGIFKGSSACAAWVTINNGLPN